MDEHFHAVVGSSESTGGEQSGPAQRGRLRDQAVDQEPLRPLNAADLGFKRRPPVCWFSPAVLAKAAQRVALSSVFGDFLDKRELQQAIEAEVLPHRGDGHEVWIDYIADTGDGFDATYSIAWLAAQPTLQPNGADRSLPRGGLLVLGGDEVYPAGSPAEYENRFRGPYLASLPHTVRDHPEVVAIPGNHDWYDGLTNFMRVFGQRKWIGGRKTVQSRSYFAVRLPHDWWLWGIDIQFDAYVDEPQLAYFEQVAQQMRERGGGRVILCTAKPSWTDVERDPEAFRNLAYLESRLLRPAGAQLWLSISGDDHHYARYEAADGTHKITAGGGGAFLHPTHHLDDPLNVPADPGMRDRKPYRLQHRYPDLHTSRRLSFHALRLPRTNWTFAAVPAVIYVLLGWSSQFANRVLERRFPLTLDASARRFGWVDLLLGLLRNPVSIALLVVVALALIGFAKPSPDWSGGRKKWVAKSAMGFAHFAVQLAAGVVVGMLAIKLASWAHGGWFNIAVVGSLAVLGGLAGTLTMGAYLAVCCAFLRAHGNEAFSSSALPDYKNFLRMHLDGDGVLTVYPIGLDRAHHRWKLDEQATDPEASWLTPDGDGLRPRLIEPPIVIDPRSGGRRRQTPGRPKACASAGGAAHSGRRSRDG